MGVLHLPPAVGEIAGVLLDSKDSPSGNSPNAISAHIPIGEAHIPMKAHITRTETMNLEPNDSKRDEEIVMVQNSI